MKSAAKRIVLLHATGRLSGLYQILGETPNATSPIEDYPPSIRYGQRGSAQTANHAKTAPRYILYREWMQAPRGKLNEFSPAQV